MNYFQSWEKGGYTEAKAMKLSRALMYAGKFGEAKGFLETLIAGNSAHAEALYRLALAYGGLNDLKKMKKTVNMLVNNRSIVYQQLAQGKMYELEKNREAAMIAYRIVMRISPENANAHAGLGNIFLANREYDSAIAHLSKAYEADSLDFQLAMSLGKACEAIGEVQSAIRLYNEVDRKSPGHPSVQMEIAHLGILMNNHGVAINALNRGIKYHPEDTEMYFRLGNEYAVTDQYELAIKTYEKAFKAGKGRNIEALKYIGNIYYSYLVNNKKAREFYRKYVKAGGKSDDVDEAMKKLEGI